MRKFLFSILASSTLLLAACSTDADEITPTKLETQLFGQLWLNSYEAKPDATPIYRPEGYVWPEPPMRYGVPFEGGDGFRLNADGTATYIAPGIGPGPTSHAAIWRRDDPAEAVFWVHLNDNYRPDFQLEIVAVDKDILRAQYVR